MNEENNYNCYLNDQSFSCTLMQAFRDSRASSSPSIDINYAVNSVRILRGSLEESDHFSKKLIDNIV